MTEASLKSVQAIFADIHNATSSQESEAGLTPCNSQAGIQTDMFGQAHAHANRFRSLESDRENLTNDTCGLTLQGLSESVVLQLSLENRLRAKS